MLNALLNTMLKIFAPILRKIDWFFIVFSSQFFPKKFLRTRTMQFWQPCPNYLVQNPIIFSQIPEKIQKFLSFPEIIACRHIFGQSGRNHQKAFFFFKLSYPKRSFGRKKNDMIKVQEKLFDFHIFFSKLFSPLTFHWTLRMQFWPLWRKLFVQILKFFCSSPRKKLEIH